MRNLRRFLSILFVLIFTATLMFAQDTDSSLDEDSEWFWNQTISEIEFEGLKNVRKSDVAGVISNYIGEPFTEEVYSDLLDRLYSVDLFDDVIPYAKHASKKNSDVLLVLQVEEHPVIDEISFVGNKQIRNGELREKIKIKASDIYVETKVLSNERLIRDFYLSRGYTNSKVTHKIEETEKGVNVIFQITEGYNTVISQILFTGNSIVSGKTLQRKMELKEVGLLKDGAFENSKLEQDKRKILAYYQDRGYVDVNITDVKIDESFNEAKSRNELTITFNIQEGSQYNFGGITLSGNEVFSEKELLACVKLREGQVFNTTKFQEGLSGLTGLYYENGYMSTEFLPIPTKDVERQTVSYHLEIVEHTRSHIENVIIKGNTKTKDYVIKREIPIESGDIFSREKIISGMRNLYNLQYFSEIVPEPQQGSEENLVDLIWSVEEKSTTNLQLAMTFSGVTDPDGIPISLSGKIENSNLFGEGKSGSVGVNWSTTEQSIDLSYSQNWIGNLPIAYSQSISFARKQTSTLVNMWTPDLQLKQKYYYMDYDGWSTTLGTAFSRRWYFDLAILSASAGINNTLGRNVYDEANYIPVDQGISLYANRWGLTNSIWTSVSADGRDINYDPTKGWFASERIAWYGLLPRFEQEFFLRSDSKLEGYYPLVNKAINENWSLKIVLAGYTGLTALFPVNGTMVSESNRVYVDGMINGRGWSDAYKMEGGKGQAMWSNKLELRMPIVPNIIGVNAFWDAAVVKSDFNTLFKSTSLDDFLFSFGPGIRFLIPQFPIHLLFAWRYQYEDNKLTWANGSFKDSFNFTLSFNIVNR